MFVQSEKFVAAHGGRRFDLAIYGQESNPTTWRLCKMNLAIRGIEGDIGPNNGDSFLNDLHPDLKADFILANPPFNMKAWGQEQLDDDMRWAYGQPPKNNANFAWVQHMIHHLAPDGRAGFLLANGSMSSTFSGEGEIRKAIVEADLVDCMFYTTQIPVCLWFLDRNKTSEDERDRRGETLFIDARQMGALVDRTHRELSEANLEKISGTYHAWRMGESPDRGESPRSIPDGDLIRPYEDEPGFCKSASLDEIRSHDYVMTPGRYVGLGELDEDDEPFDEKMGRLTGQLASQMAESDRLNTDIKINLERLGF